MDERVSYQVDGRVVELEEAVREGIYSKWYYNRDNSIAKIEMIDHDEVFKVVYPGRIPPFDPILRQHFAEYPGLPIEINTAAENTVDGGHCYRAYVYSAPQKLIQRKVCYEDNAGYLLQEVELGDDDNIVVIYRYCYDDQGHLVKVSELDHNNNIVAEQEFETE